MDKITKELELKPKARYICIANNEQISKLKDKTMIQIILKEKITIHSWFLDNITSKLIES
jgi:hypothetical protein